MKTFGTVPECTLRGFKTTLLLVNIARTPSHSLSSYVKISHEFSFLYHKQYHASYKYSSKNLGTSVVIKSNSTTRSHSERLV